MGSSGGSSSKNRTKSVQTSTETGLSTAQLEILKKRQEEYDSVFLPEIKKGLAEGTPGSDEYRRKMATLMGNNAQQVNAAFDDAQAQTTQNLAQQGLSGSANSGVSAALRASNERARASALANAYSMAQTEQDTNKQKFLSMGLQMSPTATQAAPMGAYSVSEGSGSGKTTEMSFAKKLALAATPGLTTPRD